MTLRTKCIATCTISHQNVLCNTISSLGCIVPVPRQALGECLTPTQIAPFVTIGAVLPFRGGTTHALAVCALFASFEWLRSCCGVAVNLHGTA